MMRDSLSVDARGHYQLRLPWRDLTQTLPDSRFMAECRLASLRRRFLRDPGLKASYTQVIEDYIRQGHAEPAPFAGVPGRTWYLPHHAVTHPQKPGKVRVVYDCAAKSHGVSLNDHLLQGPDFVNDLVGVLIRFRQEPVAVCGDIKQMFHQVMVSPEDRDALRFLWWPGGDTSKAPQVYRMCVHVFGATSSPSCCTFALRESADSQRGQYDDDVINTVLRNFCVDYCLRSVPTVQDACRLVPELTRLLARRGLCLEKFMLSNAPVLASIPDGARAEYMVKYKAPMLAGIPEGTRAKRMAKYKLGNDLPQKCVLGMALDLAPDVLRFDVKPINKSMTRRGMLSDMSSVFDQL